MNKHKTRQPALALPANPLESNPPDPRLNAWRRDLANKDLQGKVAAQYFVQGVKTRIVVPVANIYRQPPQKNRQKTGRKQESAGSGPALPGAVTQLLYGAEVLVFERRRGYAWVQAANDSYVGYVEEKALAAKTTRLEEKPTHRLVVPRSFLYSEADMHAAPTQVLSMGSVLSIIGEEERRGTDYALLESGEAIIAGHIRKLDYFAEDYVTIAETLLHTPYLWGGTSAFGLDCSGLVQLALHMTGRRVLRDSDMQAATIGTVLTNAHNSGKLQRGDLVFWRGHVAILRDKQHIIHASGASMTVCIESLQRAIARIAPLYGEPLLYRRP
ncbi:MAG: peptidoglycan endopeptidase [Candidatus Tokpelaia sp.]|nr:MAG: peptidoglycan endopeptidase [Candidatus Tokpelaia sp.]KAA6207322.1 MAG: peptidoglycan endopeptidase [Candidatus Tokpelaia sp.]